MKPDAYFCPLCKRQGFTKRGLRSHWCKTRASHGRKSGPLTRFEWRRFVDYAEAIASGMPVTSIKFEDHRQDFIEWDIQDNVVVDSRPFQATIWCGRRVNAVLKKGEFVHVSSETGWLEIKYPIASVRKEKR